jgi:hypothetical protein
VSDGAPTMTRDCSRLCGTAGPSWGRSEALFIIGTTLVLAAAELLTITNSCQRKTSHDHCIVDVAGSSGSGALGQLS